MLRKGYGEKCIGPVGRTEKIRYLPANTIDDNLVGHVDLI